MMGGGRKRKRRVTSRTKRPAKRRKTSKRRKAKGKLKRERVTKRKTPPTIKRDIFA